MNKKLIKEGRENFREIFSRIKRRDFKGYTGMAIKNSTYQFATNIFAKAGGLIFTIILARVLMPELFGLYSLALSTILLFISFADLGIGTALMRFISEAIAKGNPKKAKGYVSYLFKIKFFLVAIVAGILAITAKFIANNYYQKPIFLALLAGSLYILVRGFISFIRSIFQALNNFRSPFFWEIFFQITRIIIVPLTILVFLNYSPLDSTLITFIILALSFSWLLTLTFIFLFFRKKLSFLYLDSEKVKKGEQKKIKKFILPLSAMALSGIFFGYVDIIILGRFVLAEFIGQYRAAFSLVAAIAPLIVFSTVFLPIFSRIKGERLEKAFKKALKISLFLSLIVAILVFVFSSLIIKIVFGDAYLIASPLLKLLSVIIISYPITSIYVTYLFSKGKSGIVAKLLILSTILNIVLNYLFVIWLIDYSYLAAVFGVSIATIISKGIYLTGLIIARRKNL